MISLMWDSLYDSQAQRQKVEWWVPGAGGGETGGLRLNECRISFSFSKNIICLCLDRGERRERERNIDVWLPPMGPPTGGPDPQPRHVP